MLLYPARLSFFSIKQQTVSGISLCSERGNKFSCRYSGDLRGGRHSGMFKQLLSILGAE